LAISNFPLNLVEITFGPEFNQNITNLRPSIKKIKFTRYNDTRQNQKYLNVIDNDTKEYFYRYNYDKKINKLPKDTKIYLPNYNNNNGNIDNEKFYSCFNEYKDKIEYY